jgi:6-phosphogluconolactonase
MTMNAPQRTPAMIDARIAEVQTFETPEILAGHAADWMVGLARGSGQRFSVCLAGGATPRRLYELLAADPRCEVFPWPDTHWFWGDERFVPPDHPRSNFRMACEALLARAPVPRANIHAIPTQDVALEEAAVRYEAELRHFYDARPATEDHYLFDLTLLGLGEDGHVASLFPGIAATDERVRWVVPAVAAGGEPRVTLTRPALDRSRHLAFLVTGAAKRAVLARAWAGDPALPATRLEPAGDVHWFIDRAAASRRDRDATE